MKADLDKGLKPDDVLAVTFAEADMQKYRITNPRTVVRYVKKYVAVYKLPYKVQGFRANEHGKWTR
jgi:hypothetical protein